MDETMARFEVPPIYTDTVSFFTWYYNN